MILISPDQLDALPVTNRVTIPESYLDEMGHMNIQYYIQIYDRAAWELFAWLGVTLEHLEAQNAGMFALKQYIQYLAEVRVGQTVAVRSRLLEVSAKRLHFMHFMVNETTGVLASTIETVGSYADLGARRTAPFPETIAARIAERVAEHQALDWEAPTCGIFQA